MSEWPAFETDDAPVAFPATEQEISWLLPQSLASLAGELAASHEDNDNPVTQRLFTWVLSLSVLQRQR